MDQVCKVNINLKKGVITDTFPLDETIEGEIVLVPKEDLQIESLAYHLVVQAKGLVRDYERHLINESLAIQTELIEGQTYKFPLTLKNDYLETYKGINTSFLAKLDIVMKIDKRSKEGESEGLLSKIKNALPWGKTFKKTGYLTFKHQNPTYQVQTKSSELGTRTTKFLPIIFVAIFFSVFGLLMFEVQRFYVLLGIFIITILGLLYYLYLKVFLGQINIVYTQPGKDLLGIKISNQKNWKFSNAISVRYEIREKVIDRRGTTDTTHTKVVFTSEEMKVENPKGEYDFEFALSGNLPGSISFDDSQIYWAAVVSSQTIIGLPVKYDGEFIVKKR